MQLVDQYRCCIDKTSSAELSEAINSMFRWYKRAVICYAYLSDVELGGGVDMHPSYPGVPSKFAQSRWFSRGWTLQELIAPKEVVFYSRDWGIIGSRERLCLALEEITGIKRDLLNTGDVKFASVADRMTWAAKRTTTRVEDVAYCLLGIFDVNMPLLYGEGQKAFTRLQEEILRTSTDQSIFAWSLNPHIAIREYFSDVERVLRPAPTKDGGLLGGILAKSPTDFTAVENIEAFEYWPGHHGTPPRIHSKCIYIDLPVLPSTSDPETYFAVLGCRQRNDTSSLLAVPLRKWGLGGFSGRLNLLVRIPITYFSTFEKIRGQMRSLQIKGERGERRPDDKYFLIYELPPKTTGYTFPAVFVYRGARYDRPTGIITPGEASWEPQAILLFQRDIHDSLDPSRSRFVIALYSRNGTDMTHRVEAIAKPITRGQIVPLSRLEELFNSSFDPGNDGHVTKNHQKLEVSISDTTQLSVQLGLGASGARLPWEPTLNTISIAINGLSVTRKGSDWRALVVDDSDAEANPQPTDPQPTRALYRRAPSLLSKLNLNQLTRGHQKVRDLVRHSV